MAKTKDYPQAYVVRDHEGDFPVKESKLVDSKYLSLETRSTGAFADKGFYLDEDYEWVIVRDDEECLVLLPLDKD